jgi:hypothetical protein
MASSVISPPAPTENRVIFKGWLPAQEAADYLGVSREYIYRVKAIYDEGGAGVPGFMLGDASKVLMFRTTDLKAYLSKHPELGKNRKSPEPEPAEDAEDEEESGEEGAEDTPQTPATA